MWDTCVNLGKQKRSGSHWYLVTVVGSWVGLADDRSEATGWPPENQPLVLVEISWDSCLFWFIDYKMGFHDYYSFSPFNGFVHLSVPLLNYFLVEMPRVVFVFLMGLWLSKGKWLLLQWQERCMCHLGNLANHLARGSFTRSLREG
jgi:hypothetical protein